MWFVPPQVCLQHRLLPHQLQPGVCLGWPFLWQPLPGEGGVLSEAGTHRGQVPGPLPRSETQTHTHFLSLSLTHTHTQTRKTRRHLHMRRGSRQSVWQVFTSSWSEATEANEAARSRAKCRRAWFDISLPAAAPNTFRDCKIFFPLSHVWGKKKKKKLCAKIILKKKKPT